MERSFKAVTLEMMNQTAKELITFGSAVTIWKFIGNLGAGKTSLIKEICRELGVLQTVQSPTFSIVNSYETADGSEIHHFDCYRLKKMEEALDFGMEEYLDSGQLCLIEWPEIVEELLPLPILEIKIEAETSADRNIEVKIIH